VASETREETPLPPPVSGAAGTVADTAVAASTAEGSGAPANGTARLALVADSASMQGRRPKQEDRHVKIPDLTKAAKALKMPIDHLEQPCAFFAVYDGHQGHLCAEFVAKNLHVKLLRSLSADRNAAAWTDERILSVLTEIFEGLDVEFLARYRTAVDGCVVVVTVIIGMRLFVAWLGHARCVVGRQTTPAGVTALPLTEDHRPSVEAEAERVRKAGGIVVEYGAGFARVAHQGYEERLRELRRAQALGLGTIGKEPVALDVSRAFGDREFKATTGKPLLIPTPGIGSLRLDSSHKFVALLCSGVPNVMSDEDIVYELDLIREDADVLADVRAGCGALVQEAYTRGSDSNLTAIMVRLEWPGGAGCAYPRKVERIERARAAAAASLAAAFGAEGRASAAAASKRRRLEAAASVSAQKFAAYERAVSAGDAAIHNAAEEARKEAEVAAMKAEVEAAKVEVARREQEEAFKRIEAARATAAKPTAEEPQGLDAAEAFFAARRAKREAAAQAPAVAPAAGPSATEASPASMRRAGGAGTPEGGCGAEPEAQQGHLAARPELRERGGAKAAAPQGGGPGEADGPGTLAAAAPASGGGGTAAPELVEAGGTAAVRAALQQEEELPVESRAMKDMKGKTDAESSGEAPMPDDNAEGLTFL